MIWRSYQHAFENLPVQRPLEPALQIRHAYHLYTILIDKKKTGIGRDYFLETMSKKGVGVGVHYLSIAEHPYYQKTFGWQPKNYPNAMRIGRQIVSLPLSAKLTKYDVDQVISTVRSVLTRR